MGLFPLFDDAALVPPGDAVAAVRPWPPSRVARARAASTSFGTCSVLEPVADLAAPGLLPSPDRTPP